MKPQENGSAKLEALVERAARDASARAAGALETLVGQSLTTETSVRAPTASDGAEDEGYAIHFDVQELDGCDFLSTFSLTSIRTVKEMLAPGMEDSPEAEQGVALEVGNICVSHFLNALGDAMGRILLPTTPNLAPAAPLPESADEGGHDAFRIFTRFRASSGATFDGDFRFRPSPALLAALRDAQEDA